MTLRSILTRRRAACPTWRSPCWKGLLFQSCMPRQQRQKVSWSLFWPCNTSKIRNLRMQLCWIPWFLFWSGPMPLMSLWMAWMVFLWALRQEMSWWSWSTIWMWASPSCAMGSTVEGFSSSTLCQRITIWYTLLSLGSICLPNSLGAIRVRIWCTKWRFWPREASQEPPTRFLETRSLRSTCWDCQRYCPLLTDCSLMKSCLVEKGEPAQANQRKTTGRETHTDTPTQTLTSKLDCPVAWPTLLGQSVLLHRPDCLGRSHQKEVGLPMCGRLNHLTKDQKTQSKLIPTCEYVFLV